MEAVILTLVVIGALFAIVSGVWVAVALVRAVFAHRTVPGAPCEAKDKNSD